MRTVAIIQARLGSTRLPGKALMDVGGKPLLQHVVERAWQMRVDQVVIATGTLADAEAFEAGLSSVPGKETILMVPRAIDEMDVLGRFAQAAKETQADAIVRLTGDCPLLDPYIANAVLKLYRETSGCEYASNVSRGYVDGTDVEVMSRWALDAADAHATDLFDREHVSPWIRRHAVCATMQPIMKTSVDTMEDLERVRAMVGGKINGVGAC